MPEELKQTANRITAWLGGRKWAALYFFGVVVTGMAVQLQASFTEYSLAIAGMLGWTTTNSVAEDRARIKAAAGNGAQP